jgi:hypothetical protein
LKSNVLKLTSHLKKKTKLSFDINLKQKVYLTPPRFELATFGVMNDEFSDWANTIGINIYISLVSLFLVTMFSEFVS